MRLILYVGETNDVRRPFTKVRLPACPPGVSGARETVPLAEAVRALPPWTSTAAAGAAPKDWVVSVRVPGSGGAAANERPL